MKKEPRYRKDGMIYEQDRHYLAQGWPERRLSSSEFRQLLSDTASGAAVLPAPDPMKRKGRC